MAATAISFAFLLLFPIVSQAQSTVEFIFNGFKGGDQNLSLDGAAAIIDGGLLRLTNNSPNAVGHALYPIPIQMFDKNSSSYPNAFSFYTSFVFAIVPPSSGRGGHGLAFFLSSTNQFPGAEAGAVGNNLGLFNSSNQGSSSNYICAVEFDTVNGDGEGDHVGINNNSLTYGPIEPNGFSPNDKNIEDLRLQSGEPIYAWIDYDGVKKLVNVTISPSYNKPTKPLFSYPLDLTPLVKDRMYVGFSSSTGITLSSSHYILGWSFGMNRAAPQLNPLILPKLPPSENKKKSSFNPQLVPLIASISAITLILLGMLIFMAYRKKVMRHESLEKWELDCPHRFQYKDLHAATKGFKESEVIGVGGFGVVYKGVFPATGSEVAVKKIVRNSIHGLREFAAEIESLGRLRHKNLVNLQGWCKQKNDLMIVYDYISNGSLYSLLYKPKNNFVLTWDQRFNILKGIASGLLYLHEDWDQVVIHRDVKSSNVLIDADMNPRLGDFGLARLYDHGILSHTTNVAGTVGYIAPELARAGKASTSSDVFAYGVLLFEMATGRRPIGSGNFVLVDWVTEFHQLDQLVEVIDPKLNSPDVVEEVKLVLELGLRCSHHKPEDRPTMRQVTRFLNGDDSLPALDWSSINDSRSASEMNSRLLEVTSTSIGVMSSSSIDVGR